MPLLPEYVSSTPPGIKYLGIWLNEHLDYQKCVTALPDTDMLAKFSSGQVIVLLHVYISMFHTRKDSQ